MHVRSTSATASDGRGRWWLALCVQTALLVGGHWCEGGSGARDIDDLTGPRTVHADMVGTHAACHGLYPAAALGRGSGRTNASCAANDVLATHEGPHTFVTGATLPLPGAGGYLGAASFSRGLVLAQHLAPHVVTSLDWATCRLCTGLPAVPASASMRHRWLAHVVGHGPSHICAHRSCRPESAHGSHRARTPHENHIQFPLFGGGEQCMALRTAVFRARRDLLHGGDDGPAAAGRERVQRVPLHVQGLLVVGRDARIDHRTHGLHKTTLQLVESEH